MGQLGVLSAAQVAEAQQEALPTQARRFPFHAPHLAERLRQSRPRAVVQNTFIDGKLQYSLETLAREQQSGPLTANGSGLAILVVAHHEQRVLAYLGGSDFHDASRAGQVDLIRAVRSPGSTLKPLVYGLGFDDLLIHPETLIEDVPDRFSRKLQPHQLPQHLRWASDGA